MKKVLSILTSLAMVLSMLPAIAFAAGTQENPNEQNAKSVLAEGGGGNSSASTAGPPQSKNSQTNSAKTSSKASAKSSSKSSSKAGAKTSAETSSKTGAAATSAATATTKTTTKSSKTATVSPELTISGGTLDTDYTYDESSHVITILTDAALTISGTTQTDRIVVSASTANITLDGLTLKNNNWSTNPFDIGSSNTTITLAGGSENTITAPNGAAGIYVAPSGKLTIEGDDTSSLTANGDYGAGIGGYFNHESSGDITIKGGNITVTNGIGNARGGNGGTYTVSGGSLNVDYITSGNGNGKLVIENGASVNVERETLEATVLITCGTLLHNGDVTVGGDMTLLDSVTSIASGKSLTVQEGGKLSIPAGANVAIDGDIVNNGEIVVSSDVALTLNGVLYNNGSLTNNGTISGSGTFIGNDISAQSTGTSTINTAPVGTGTIDVSCGNVTLLKSGYWSGDTLYSFDYTSPITLTGTTSEYIVKIEDGLEANIALKDLSMDASNIGTSVVPIDLTGGKINLSFSGTNTLKPTSGRPCIAVQNGSELTIESSSGTLDLNGSSWAPAIGAIDSNERGDLTIKSGNITTTSRFSKLNNLNIIGGNITTQDSFTDITNCVISDGNVKCKYGISCDSFSTGDSGRAIISLGSTINNRDNIDNWQAIIAENSGQYVVYGNYTLQQDYTVDNGLEVKEGATLIVPQGTTLTNNAIINVYGTLTVDGNYSGSGLVYKKDAGVINGLNAPSESEIPNNPTINLSGVSTLVIEDTLYKLNGVEYPYTGTITITGEGEAAITLSGGTTESPRKVVLSGVSGNSRVDVPNNAVADIELVGENTLVSNSGTTAALHVSTSASLNLHGGKLTALTKNGGNFWYGDAAAIGGNVSESAGTITIQDCEIAASSVGACAIGCGRAPSRNYVADAINPITIKNSLVEAYGSSTYVSMRANGLTLEDSVINAANGIDGTINTGAWKGVVIKGTTGEVYGSPTISHDFTNSQNCGLSVAAGNTLTLADGTTLTNNGDILVRGTITGGTIINNGKIVTTDAGTVTSVVQGNAVIASTYVTPTGVSINEGSENVSISNGVLTITGDAALSRLGNKDIQSEFIVISGGTQDDPITVSLENITISGDYSNQPIKIADNSYVRIVIKGENSFISGHQGSGICVPSSSTLYLTCANAAEGHICDENCGSIYAQGSGESCSGQPAIGSQDAGDIYIEGGNIVAIGVDGAIGPVYLGSGAAIGSSNTNGNCGLISISGGNVRTGGNGHSDGTPEIGGPGATVVISGGTVSSKESRYNCTIGGDSFSTGENGTAVVNIKMRDGVQTDKSEWSGYFTENGGLTVYGEQTLLSTVETVANIAENAKLTIPSGREMTIPDGKTFSNSGEFVIAQGGTLTVLGDAANTETGTVTALGTVNKKAQAAPAAPQMSSVESDKIILKEISAGKTAVEYACTSSAAAEPQNWQSSTTFSGLSQETIYYFYSRYVSNDYYAASPLSSASDIQIQVIADADVTATGVDTVYDGQIHDATVTVDAGVSGATVKYGTTEGTYDRDYCPYYVSAGTYTVYYKVSASGYVDYEGSVDVKIAKKPLTITAAAQNKDYDGTDDAVVDAALDTSGVVYYDEVALVSDGVAPTFDSKNSGTDKAVTLNGEYTLSGTAAQNYTLTQPTNLKASINKIELTIKNLEVADKFYDGLDTASFSATPQLSGVVGEEDVVLVNGTPSFDSVAVGNDIVINFTDFSLSGDDIGNYTLVQPVQGSVVASIKAYNATGEEYSVNSNDWLNEDFVASAKEGWKLSYTNTAQGNGWVDSLSASEETSEGALQFYVKNTNTGVISEAITETYKIDKTAPDGRIYMIDETKTDEGNIDWDKVWETFVDPISFDIFLNNKQEVVLDGRDRTSGVAKWEYFISAQDLSKEELKDKTFTEYSDIFSIEPDDKFIIYARISDYAGNVTYIRSNGVVLDGTAPVISGADDEKTYCAAVTLTITDEYLDTVTLNGGPVALTDGKLTLEPASGKQIVVATDKAGNSTTISVTVNDGHTWGNWASNGDGTHTRTCQFDATYTETADCHGGTATCSAKAICEDCGAGYGEIDPSNHAGLKHVKAKAATTAAAGNTEYWYCIGCGKYFSDATAVAEIQQADTVIAKLASEDNSKDTSKNVNTPQNGDDSLILLMLALCLASGVVLASSIIIRRKLRYDK